MGHLAGGDIATKYDDDSDEAKGSEDASHGAGCLGEVKVDVVEQAVLGLSG